MDKSVPQVTVWHHSAEPLDAKTMTLGGDLPNCTSHSCQILIVSLLVHFPCPCSHNLAFDLEISNELSLLG